MECVKNLQTFIDGFDKELESGDLRILKYGLSLKYNFDEGKGKSRNKQKTISPNGYIENGEFAVYDDNYDITYFHRLESTKVEQEGGYGSKIGIKNIFKVTIVAWGKAASISQLGLYDLFCTYLYHSGAAVLDAKFDIAKIEKEENQDNYVNVESVLVKITYSLTLPENYCKQKCKFEPCNSTT